MKTVKKSYEISRDKTLEISKLFITVFITVFIIFYPWQFFIPESIIKKCSTQTHTQNNTDLFFHNLVTSISFITSMATLYLNKNTNVIVDTV